jgi:hypothetical protein
VGKTLALFVCAAITFVASAVIPANAQWRATAWTLDFRNETDLCVALVIGEDGGPPVDQATVWAHRGQHFDDNHLGVIIHAKIFERDCSGKFIADLHQPMHQLRNIVSVRNDGNAFAMHREETQDLNSYNNGISTGSVDRASDADVQFGPPGPVYRVQTFAVAGVRLGDDARAVSAVAAKSGSPHKTAQSVTFSTPEGAAVTVGMRAGRAWKIAARMATATPPAAARFARAALTRYGQQPTTQQSGTYILVHYCTTARMDPTSHAAVACEGSGPALEVLAGVPESHIELK